jgi:hypothetical protein
VSWRRATAANVRAGQTIRVPGIRWTRVIRPVVEVEQAPGKPVRITGRGGKVTELKPGKRVDIGPRGRRRNINTP